MFKIENYIAPLILSKVEKFVKNINQPQEHFQVSLWQGDVVFQNLELKLDVLEEELQLPVSFLSGHINDLKIQIPWTKIASEPITITINTIELVVKLKDFSSVPPVQKPKLKKKISIDEDAQAGYMASLITKILNNMSVICNNIVLKFIEEDIVISMNIQHLSVHSADHRWRRSFIDVSPTNVLFRKLVNIIDFTICLDKRNSSGKIEFVQEPILYKCSMELRLYRKYNATTPAKLSLTRIDIQTNALNLNISSQQFPMLMRLYDLVMALKTGKLQAKYSENSQTQPDETEEQAGDDSWLLWAWNMIPALLPDEEQNEQDETSDKKIFEFGFYVEEINLSLKAQEFLSDPIIPSTKKAVFKPLLAIHAQEFYCVTIISGIRKFNVKCGIGFVEVLAVDDCVCGANCTETQLIIAGSREKTGNYLKDSFMDKDAATMQTKYEDMWTNYYGKNNEEALLARTPTLSLDILHTVEVPDDAKSSDIGSDLEFSNFSEAYVIRVFGGGFIISAGADMIHRVERLIQYYKDCDFLPYVEQEKPLLKNQLSPATADDYDALINEVPLKVVQMKLRNSTVIVKEWDHKKRAVKKPSVVLEVKIDETLIELKQPLYRNRLIYTACQLPENELFEKCFLEFTVTLKTIKVDMKFLNDRRICEVSSLSSSVKRLIYPHLWADADLQENFLSVVATGVSFMINPAQLMALQLIVTSIMKRTASDAELEKDVLRNLEKSDLVVVQLVMQKIRMTVAETSTCFFAKISISDLLGMAWQSGVKSMIINWPDSADANNRQVLMVAHLQSPKGKDVKLLPVVTLHVSEGSVNLDPLLREFLQFRVIPDEPRILVRTISTSTKPAINDQLMSMQSSSECDATICPANPENETENPVDWFEIYRNFIINVELKPLTVYYTLQHIDSKPSDSLRSLLAKSNGKILMIKSPNFTFHSVKNKSIAELVSRHFTGELQANLWGNEKALTWNLVLSEMSAQSRNGGKRFNLIEDLSMNISIADETTTSSDVITGNILIETSPLMLCLHTSQMSLIKLAIDEVSNFTQRKKVEAAVRIEKTLSVIHESPQNTSEIKEFLGLATGSTTTKTSHADEKSKKSKSRCSLYVQWVCSKITLTLLADDLTMQKKFIFEVDEILFSLHQQDFYQLKSKIAAVSGNFYEKLENDEKWTKNISLGLSVQTDGNVSDNANRFLDLTITKAETVNVHSRWNVGHKRNRLYNDVITEINVVLQPLDIISNLDEIVHFMPIFALMRSGATAEKSVQKAGSDLPLVHVVCSGFRIFLPCVTESTDAPDVLIIKINNLHVTPTATNNLIRNQILRPDIHSKACSLGILDLAGSKIEDRQYQVIVKGVSLSTSSWNGITALINEKTMVESYDNPAFEWNNLENGPKSPKFKLNTIFKDSTFSFIYAPCIRFKETLVAGTAMEFNCVNDMNIEMTLKELALFIQIGERLTKISKLVQPETFVTPPPDEIDEMPTRKIFFEKKSAEDSGVESISQSKDRRLWKKKTLVNEDAFEFTFTSSKFRLRCSLGDYEDEIMIVLDTPNVFITQDKYEKSVNLSLYDLYVEKVFTTRDGSSDLSGIKPSLIRIKFTEKSVKSFDCDIQIKRPIAIDFNHEKLQKLFNLLNLLESSLILKPNQKQEIPIEKKAKKFDIIKLHLRDIKTLSFATSQIVFNLKSHKYEFKMALSETKGKLRAFDRPEKIEKSFEIINLMLLNRGKMILHPVTLQAKFKIVQEYWKKDPMMHANLKVGYIRVDVGQDFLKDVSAAKENFQNVLNQRKVENELKKNPPSAFLIQLTPKSFTNSVHSTVEHFQDDLRSGAFQFVETSTLRDLPLPYQIQIIDNDVGVICWRYPLPRALHKIKIFPVPFHTANQVTIICKLEFYSQLKSQFEEFCEFTLTENETRMLDLKQNRPSAEVWRIKIPRVTLKRDSDDEDEGGDYEFQMHPKVLVACLRIDSYYVSSAIPNFNFFAEISHAEMNLMNKMKAVEKIPETVSKFQLLDDRGKEHEAAKVVLKKIKVLGQFFDENYENFEIDATIGADVIDYGCGNLVPLVDDFRLKALADFHFNDVNLNFMTEKIQLKYSPSIGHSLLMTRRIWSDSDELHLHTKFIVCNNTASPIGISQFQTNEMICLMPQSFVLYHFRTDKLEQLMQFCVCLKGVWSLKTTPIQIHSEGVEYVKLDENQFFIVTVKSVTNFQRRVTIDGSVRVFNMTKEVFRVQYKRYDKDIDAPDKSESMEFDVDGQQSVSVFGTCLADSQQSIRLRMVKNEKKVFSGEIPLREIVVNNKPWLVKVPSLAQCGFTSFWVRIIRQTENEISQVLVMVWPMFVTKSLFPINTTVFEESRDESHVVEGRGLIRELNMCGTHEDEHDLLMKGNYAMLDGEAAKVKLSYKLINRNSFFKIPDEFSNVQKAIEKLEEVVEEPWPCKRDEEFRCNRDITLNGPTTLPVYHLSSKTPEELSCSLMLTLSPWCSVINSTGCLLKLTNQVTSEHCSVEVNNIAMPFHINSTFTISLLINHVWAHSDPIYINTDVKRTLPNNYALPIEGHLPLILQTDTEIIQILVTSSIENKMRLIVMSSLVVVVNYSNINLRVFSFAADIGEKVEGLKRNEIPTKRFVEITANLPNDQGTPISTFTDLIPAKSKRKINTSFVLFIAFGSEACETSFPIKIQQTMRKCLSIGDVPISLSIIKHNEQFFVSVHDDHSPLISIRNETDFNLFVASLEANPSAKYILPHREVADERFSFFQTIPSKQRIFYTPPVVNEHFPEIINPDFGLILACVTGDDFVRWSQPIKLDGTKKIIINVPMFGDVKLNVDVSGKTAMVTISYLQQKQEDVKEMHRQVTRHSFLEVNSNYQKTFSVLRKAAPRAFNLNFYSKGVSCTIYKDAGRKRVEMITLIIDDIGVKFSKLLRNAKMSFGKIQVDNELFPLGEYDFPVVLCNKDLPDEVDLSGTSVWDLSDFLDEQSKENRFTVDVDLYETGGIENIAVKLQPIRVYIEDTFINFIIQMVEDCLPTNLIPKSTKDDEKINLLNGMVLVPKSVVIQALNLSEPLRLKSIRLDPLHVLLSVHTCMRMYIALDHSPLDFSAYEKFNIYTLPMKLGNSMGMHYLSSAIFGAGWVVGSLEILGSPSGLARSFTSGFKDFVSMPVQGLFKGPWAFLVGLTQGSVSLVSHVTTGTVNSVTKLASSLARNLDRLTLDSEHIHLKTDASRRHRPHGLTEGLQQGLTGFGISILGAIGGLARHPLQAKSTVEVFTGVGKGIVGVFAKPISGAAEFVALTGTGMLQSVGYNLLPNPISHHIENCLMQPTADKIISKQLPQYASTNVILFTCCGTFSRKNELKNSFIVLLSNVMVIADLDRDMVMDVVLLERIQPVHKAGSADNLFVFKIKDDEDSPTNHELKYPVSKRTVQYIQQLSGHQNNTEDISEDENGFSTKLDSDEVESLSAIGTDKKISFYIDEATGKYLVGYLNLIKTQIQAKNNLFPLFEA